MLTSYDVSASLCTSSSSLSSAMTMAALTSIALKPYRSAAGRSLDNLSMSRIGA